MSNVCKTYFSNICNKNIIKIILLQSIINPIQVGLFRCCSRIRAVGEPFGPPSLKSATQILQWWTLAQLYLTYRRFKKFKNHVTQPLGSADISIFSPKTSKFCYIKKSTYILDFDAWFLFFFFNYSWVFSNCFNKPG